MFELESKNQEIIDSVDLIRDVYMGSIDKSDLTGYNLKYLKYGKISRYRNF